MAVAEQQSFGERLKALRLVAKLTPYQLGKKADLSGQAVTMLEKGERQPTWETVVKLARALKVEVSEFDTGEDPREQSEEEPDEQPATPKKPNKPKKPIK